MPNSRLPKARGTRHVSTLVLNTWIEQARAIMAQCQRYSGPMIITSLATFEGETQPSILAPVSERLGQWELRYSRVGQCRDIVKRLYPVEMLSATDEQSNQWHTGERGNKSMAMTAMTMTMTTTTSATAAAATTRGEKRKCPPTSLRPHARRTCSNSSTRLHCREW